MQGNDFPVNHHVHGLIQMEFDAAHFADLGKLWAAGEYFLLSFSEREVAANAHTTLMLVPRK